MGEPMRVLTEAAPCNLDTQWLGFYDDQPSGVACGEPSFATVRLACIHEHVDEVRICSGCAVDMQHATGIITCKRCWSSLLRTHACLMLVVIDWDSGEKTIVQEPGR